MFIRATFRCEVPSEEDGPRTPPPAGWASWSAASKVLVRPARASGPPRAEPGAGGTGPGGAQQRAALISYMARSGSRSYPSLPNVPCREAQGLTGRSRYAMAKGGDPDYRTPPPNRQTALWILLFIISLALAAGRDDQATEAPCEVAPVCRTGQSVCVCTSTDNCSSCAPNRQGYLGRDGASYPSLCVADLQAVCKSVRRLLWALQRLKGQGVI